MTDCVIDFFVDSTVKIQKDYHLNPEYFTRVLQPNLYIIHWKFIGDEIEIVVEAFTSSWVGIGWKPVELNDTCKNFPHPLKAAVNLSNPSNTAMQENKNASFRMVSNFSHSRLPPERDDGVVHNILGFPEGRTE